MKILAALLLSAVLAFASTMKTVCPSGCDYTTPQAAINDAEFGWIIELTAGATFSGEVQLKKKTGTPAYIVIRSSKAGELPGGVRVSIGDTAKMAKLQNTGNVVTVEKGASYYRLEGLEIAPTSGSVIYNLTAFFPQTPVGDVDVHTEADRAHHLIIDRCYLHGNAADDGPRVGAYLETGYTEITNSWFGEIKDQNSEAKAVLNVGGPGPFVFRNNHLEAAAITTLMGGADPSIPGTRATDVTFLGNHYYRPWKWRIRGVTSDPTGTCLWDARGGEFAHNTTGATYWECQSGTWTEITVGAYPALTVFWQKNQFELKNASRVLVDGNLIENAWLPTAQQQHGAAFLFNQVGYYPGGGILDNYAVVKHVQVQNNRIKNTPWGVAAGGNGETYVERIHDVQIENNLFTGLGDEPQSLGDSYVLQSGAQTDQMRYVHNTFINNPATGAGAIASMNNRGIGGDTYGLNGPFSYEMQFVGNIVNFASGGFVDTEKANGTSANSIASQWDRSGSLSKNVVVDIQGLRPWPSYPERNFYWAASGDWAGRGSACLSCAVGTEAGGPWAWENGGTNDVGFVDFAGGGYRLAATSPYKGWAHLGQDAGADIDIVEWSTEHAADGAYNPYLDFRVRAVKPGRTSASLRFTAYNGNSCEVRVSDRPDLATTEFERTDGGGDRDRVVEVAGLSANTRYFYRIICSGPYRRDGMFLTAP